MTESEFSLNIESLIERFRNVAYRSLMRIAQSLGIECIEGYYDAVVSAARKSRSGVISDEEGLMQYRFHGSGCEIIIENVIFDFNIYPKRADKSPILVGVFEFQKYLCSIGIDLSRDIIAQTLEMAVEKELINHYNGPYSYSFVRRRPPQERTHEAYRIFMAQRDKNE